MEVGEDWRRTDVGGRDENLVHVHCLNQFYTTGPKKLPGETVSVIGQYRLIVSDNLYNGWGLLKVIVFFNARLLEI